MWYEPSRFERFLDWKHDNEEDHGDVEYGEYPSL
jgi:hypothetical protein